MNMNDKLKNRELESRALAAGFTKASWLDDLKLECEARLRAYCNPEGCPEHGNNWVCPPGCGSIQECAEKINLFDKGILLQSVSEFHLPVEKEKYEILNREHSLRLKEFLKIMGEYWPTLLALTNGGCVFCDTCTYPDPCVKPDTRMNSLSAYGIDVGKLCARAEWKYAFRPDQVFYIALVLAK